MTIQDIYQRWKSFGLIDHDKSLYLEYVSLCNFISDEDFYYYLHPEKATEGQFLSVLDFLYQQDCYMLLYRFLRDNKSRLIYPDFDTIEGIAIRPDIEKRFEKLCL